MSLISQAKLFGHTRKDISQEEASINAQLLTRAGFIEKNMAGVYSYLPLGLRVLRKIENVIREEMNRLGGQEILMPVLQNKEVWSQTGRWQDSMGGVMYKFKDSGGHEFGLGPTHEEVVVDLLKRHVKSYKDLPLYIYQIQDKFRDEPRAKSGLLRGREFIMKDLYSFTATKDESDSFYQKAQTAYFKVFERLGLKAILVEASGGSMSKKHSHEFMAVTKAGEDTTVFCSACHWAQNKEIASVQAGDACPNCGQPLLQEKTVELGNIFDQETYYTEKLGATYTAADGSVQPIYMGAYGIGVGRAMGTVVEASHDDKGIIWPDEITPADIHLILLSEDTKVAAIGQGLAQKLATKYEVLLDDRISSVGAKLADADLIGIPIQLIVGPKVMPQVEWKQRHDGVVTVVSPDEVMALADKYYVQKDIR
ncbi:MAG: aminoacyl--tRNA ligase-related protein [Candidatus Komeilibacteria bacterium]